ncbi:hypothetical protein DL771_005073 [Monosporascus sp. 5C6A]|nr:hypothetical protein DL771_005073 [Monosporascus sp. 5C6A]
MSIRDLGEPPTKKRRFFAEPEEDSRTHDALPDSNAGPPRSPLRETAVDDASNRGVPLNGHPATSSPASAPVDTSESPSFDKNTFESLLGDKVKPEVLDIIRANCGNNLEQAVNMYFDGTWMRFRKPKPAFNTPNPLPSRMPPVSADHSKEPDPPPKPPIAQSMPESRYIGAFGVEGWATRSGTNLLKHGETVRIERQKIQPPNGRSLAPQRAPLAVSKRVDVIVRFTDAKGNEIGRLAKDTANWVSSLIDQKVCKFEGTCVYAPERLRTNDTIFLQLKCYLLRHAFLSSGFRLSENRSTGVYEEKETAEERDLRLRQVALVRLFQEINLLPTRTSDAARNHNRQDLLQAAETADKQDRGTSMSNDRDTPGSSPPSEDAEEGQELEQEQLDTLYQKAQSFDFSTPEAEPPDTFAMTLRPYQKQSLYWMLRKEKDLKNEVRESSMHPLWEEYSWPTKDADDKDVVQVEGQSKFYVNPYSGEMSLDFPVQEQHCLGGILADEMGLGKTIQMLSLIHSHKSEAVLGSTKPVDSVNNLPRMPGSHSASVVAAPKTTLVVAPMSLLAQWQSEAENASKEGTLKSMVYYGGDKIGDLQALCREANIASAPDLVITSYGVVLSEFSQVAKSGIKDRGLFSLNFFRIILDEAHTIKNRQSKTAKACYELSAEHRWVLTGTPIVNRLEDLFSLVRFLRVEPWNNFSFWRTFITVPFESKNFMRALDVVQTVLEPLVMRRTKEMRTPDGQLLVPLPPKSIEIVNVELSKPERDVYEHIFTRAKRTFSASVEKGTVMKAYTTIFAQILRLRQSCCHPILVRNQDIVADEEIAGAEADAAAGLADDMDLQSLIERFTATTDDKKDANAFGAHVLQQIRDEAADECPICAEEPMIDQTVTGCWHSACKKCLLDYIKHSTDRQEVPRCFNCREYINSRDLFQVVRHDDDPDAALQDSPKISLQRLGANESSSKVVALIKHLRDLRREHPQIKSVVFSQFTSFMSLIEPALAKANMKCLRLDGTLSQKARAAVLTEFRESDKFTILLISLRAGGVGLNLTQAKRVYMMDPWWSFAVEAQAIDRVHRMGQEDEVKVYRFITKDSVEERMLKVQDRKKFIRAFMPAPRWGTIVPPPPPQCRASHVDATISRRASQAPQFGTVVGPPPPSPAAQIPQARARATEDPTPAPSVARDAPPKPPGAGGVGTGVDGSAGLVDGADGLPVFCHIMGYLVVRHLRCRRGAPFGEPDMSSPNYSNLSEFLSSPPAAPAEQHQRPSRQQRRVRRTRRGNRVIVRNGTARQQLELQGLIVHRLEAISNQLGILIDGITPDLFDGRSTIIGRASPIADTASRSRSATLEPYPMYQGPPTPPTEQASSGNPQQPDNLPFDMPDYTRVRSAGGPEPSPGGGAAGPSSAPESLLRRRALTVAMVEVDLAETRRQLRDLRAIARYGPAAMVADAVEALASGLEDIIEQDLDRLRSLQHEEARQQWTTAGLASSSRFAGAQPPTPAQVQAPFAPYPSLPGPRRCAASCLTPGYARAVSPPGSDVGPDDWTHEHLDPEPDWAVVGCGGCRACGCDS